MAVPNSVSLVQLSAASTIPPHRPASTNLALSFIGFPLPHYQEAFALTIHGTQVRLVRALLRRQEMRGIFEDGANADKENICSSGILKDLI